MLLNKTVKLIWNSGTKRYYNGKGECKFSNIGDEFEIPIEFLTPSSVVKINCKCDFCHEEFKREYRHIVRGRKTSDYDACPNCRIKKTETTNIEKYGTTTPLKNEEVKNKIKETNIERYGVENISQLDEVRNIKRLKTMKNYDEVKDFIDNNECLLLTEEKDYINTENPINIKCGCGNTFCTSFHEFRGGNKRQCNSCGRKKIEKEGNGNWKGGVATENEILRGSVEYKEWRMQVYKRDKYTCQCCNQKSGNINAHHLDGWNWSKEQRYDITNGTTLCETCHNDFHNIYGSGDNTKEQYDEFIKDKQKELKVAQ